MTVENLCFHQQQHLNMPLLIYQLQDLVEKLLFITFTDQSCIQKENSKRFKTLKIMFTTRSTTRALYRSHVIQILKYQNKIDFLKKIDTFKRLTS